MKIKWDLTKSLRKLQSKVYKTHRSKNNIDYNNTCYMNANSRKTKE